ncbi:hypothetical protein PR048_007388 [Dryococelus australis]|uniref:Uncharacterized protein n=1 Tax=Dryococelus australis TaxID=614101 RepID=A0ABQ9HV14_9NEOP|nr:hypothetical protein PR048_007388 [Dryococelus australis]
MYQGNTGEGTEINNEETRIFLHDFNVGFRSPSSDFCTICIRLQHQIPSANHNTSKINLLMQLRLHKLRVNTFYDLAKKSPSSTNSVCFDLQQVQLLPRTPIQDPFYSRQMGFYSLCCVPMGSKNQDFMFGQKIRQEGVRLKCLLHDCTVSATIYLTTCPVSTCFVMTVETKTKESCCTYIDTLASTVCVWEY